MQADRLQTGINARLFPANWRPVVQEIAFAQQHQFKSIQLPGKEAGLDETHLGASLATVRDALLAADLMPVMEIVIHLDAQGKTASGKTPLAILNANLPAITTLKIPYVHWHLVPLSEVDPAPMPELETSLYPQFEQAAMLARQHGFTFGFEHNEPDLQLFGQPEACQQLLDAVPGLGFVWDFNHTIPAHLDAFKALIPRMTMLHVSDTPLPEVNYHLPLGLGSVDLVDYCRALLQADFHGAAILEIGGLPKSGGYGRDTDAALIESGQRLAQAVRAAAALLSG